MTVIVLFIVELINILFYSKIISNILLKILSQKYPHFAVTIFNTCFFLQYKSFSIDQYQKYNIIITKYRFTMRKIIKLLYCILIIIVYILANVFF